MSYILTSNESLITYLRTGRSKDKSLLYYTSDDVKTIKRIELKMSFNEGSEIYHLNSGSGNDQIMGTVVIKNGEMYICESNFEKHNEFFKSIGDFFMKNRWYRD